MEAPSHQRRQPKPQRTGSRTMIKHSYSHTALLQLLRESARIAGDATSLVDGLKQTIDLVCTQTGWPVGHVYLQAGNERALLAPTTLWHIAPPAPFTTLRMVTEATCFPVGYGRVGEVLATGTPLWSNDVRSDPKFVRAHQHANIEARGFFAFPVIYGHEVVAVCEFFTTEAVDCDSDLLEVGATVGLQLGRVIEREQARGELPMPSQMVAGPVLGQMSIIRAHAVGELATVLSHAINNPLFAARANLMILASDPHLSAAANAYLNEAQHELGRIAATMERMHQRVQLVELKRRRCLLSDIVVEAINVAEIWPQWQQITLHYRALAQPVIHADIVKLRQALLHLMGNALQAMPEGGALHIIVEIVGGRAIVEIADSGCGLPDAMRGQMFDPFTTTRADGTGLGLAIAHSIIEQHGGTLVVDDHCEGGCVARVSLPLDV